MFNISEYSKQVFRNNGIITCDDIYKTNEIKESEDKEKYNGIYISTASKQNNDKKLFIYYLELTKSYPNLSSLLICNEETKKEEIISFLFRVFLCPSKTLFSISKSDSLTKFNKIFLIEKVNEFMKMYRDNMKSILIIFHSDDKSEIKKGFNNIKEVKVFQSKFENNIYKEDYINKVQKLKKIAVVDSERCGEGKSTFIKTRTKNSTKNYIYFQIGGVFTRKSLFERLINQINIQEKQAQYLLHIDLTYTELKDLVLEFLFKFLIMKYYNCDNNIFCYDRNQFEVFIEIHNEISNFEILKFCNTIHKKMDPLNDEENDNLEKKDKRIESSKIQIVAQIFQKLYKKKIGVSNIDLHSSKYLPINKVQEKDNEKIEFVSCQQFIDYYFNNNSDNDLKIENPNYYQKKMFINLLADQFTRFTKSIFLSPHLLFENFSARNNNNDEIGKKKSIEIRELIINSLIKNTLLFVKGPYENLMKEQKETDIFLISEEEKNREEINRLANDKLKTMVTYDNIKQSILAFDDNKSSFFFKIIPSNSCNKEEYDQLNELFNTQSAIEKSVKLKRPKDKNEKELLGDILDLCGAENEIKREEYLREIKKKYPGYAFTTDNYIKMVYILMKIRANIPIIMMGETGCGKTSLIKMLSLIKNQGKETRMKILNIHQGIGDDEIISFLERVMEETKKEDEDLILTEKNKFLEYLKEEEETLKKKKEEQDKKKNDKNQEEQNKKKENEFKLKEERKKRAFDEITKEVHERQMWLFFDEINTCNSMGLISEIFCNRTYRGKPIPERFAFIGACNPYRIASEKNKNIEVCLNLRNKKQSNLVYTVNPLPHSLLNYVMDFGELSNQDIEIYIRKMIEKVIEEPELLEMAVKTVGKCHMFIKEKSDSSSVSLRDIKYFNIFYQGFIKYFEYLKKLSKKQNLGLSRENIKLKDYIDMGNTSIKKQSINLSAYISYFLRLPTKSLREELVGILDKLADQKRNKYFDYGFLHIPLKESGYILDQLDINPERGIAKNNALRENIFCELFCLVNKVPLIICGKPGNSKTLSVQLLLDNMKGKSSLNEFFKNPDYKEVMPYFFQGSTTCTSKGVLKAFEKARNFSSKNEEMLSLVFFDEMGLAEESNDNPLKVLHAELEREDNNLAFFGISNWALDASKMNRGIRIFVQDPDKDDLNITASEIAKSIDEKLFKDNEEVFKFLSEAYCQFREEKAITTYKDFHGNRDFYNLIRNTMKYLKEEKGDKEGEENIPYIRNISAIKAIERNFGGYDKSVSDMKKIFYDVSKYNNINHRYNIVENISDNFNDPNSRYLLLISKNSTSQNLIEQIIQKEKKESVIYIGSQFKGDKSESYTEEILYKIQMQMENETILILKGLEIIYPSLYDLFNQNFSEFNGNRYAKISFSNNQSTSLINNKFKIVVLVDKQMVQYEDKPFLNRFEKHVISFENILQPNYVRLVNNINSKIEELTKFESNDEKKKLIVNLKKQLICCDKEVIENLVFNLTDNNDNLSNDEITSKIFELISPTLTQDIISCINLNGFIEKERDLANIIENSYNKTYASNINDYIKKIPKSKLRHIIYTFSNLTELIFKDNEQEEEKSMFTKQKTTEIVIDSIESTKKLEILIDQFYKSQNNLCIIKFEEEDLNKMNYVKSIIDSIEKIESTINFKYYLFIVYMKRELTTENINNQDNKQLYKKEIIIKDQIALMDNFNQVTIDNLNNENDKYNIFDLTSKNNKSIIKTLFDVEQIINDNIYNCFNQIKFTFKNITKKFGINDYKQKLSEGIVKSEYLMKKLEEILNKMCKNITEMISEILTNSNSFHNDDVEILSIIRAYYKNDIISTLEKIIYIFEKNQILSSYILHNKEIYKKIIDLFAENIDLQFINIKQPLKIILGLKVPQTYVLLGKMTTFLKNNIIEKYSENENLLRTYLPDDMNENEAKNKYEKLKYELETNTKNQINKIKELNEILKINDISIIKAFFKDLYMIFLSNKYNVITDVMIKLLDSITQIYFLDKNSLNNENDFSTSYAEKLYEKHKNNIENNDYDDYFCDLVKLLLFFQNYSDFIFFIINVYLDIYKFSPLIEEKFINSFINENFEHEKSDRCEEYFAIVNSKLFKIFESLIFTIKKILYLLCEQKENIEEYIIFIKSNISEFKQFNSIFSFYSKEIYTLQNLILVFKSFEKEDKKFENNDLIEITGLLDNERNYINQNLQNELADNLEKMKNIFIKYLDEKSDEYSSLFINILLNEYRIYQNDDHRNKIVEMICGNNNLIKKSIPILEYIFSGIEPEEELEDNAAENEGENNNNENNPLKSYFMKTEEENKIYKLIEEEGNNNTFHQILLFLFECQIENFFVKLKKKYYNEKNNDIYAEKLFKSSAFIYFKSLLSIYMKIKNDKITPEKAYTTLLKLYSIAYIKRYLTYYIDLKLESQYDSDNLKNDEILNFENNDENQPNEIKLLKIYMLKLINQKGIDIYTYQLEERHLNFLKEFIENYREDKENNEDGKEDEKKQKDACIFNLRQGHLDLNLEKQIDSVKNNERELNNLIENLYSLLANQYMPKYLTEGKDSNIDEDNTNIWKNILESNFNISQEIKTFFENILSIGFYIKLKSKLPKDYQLNEEKINIILFILKFVLISIKNNKINIFSSLLNKEKVHNILKKSFLPGVPLASKSNYTKYLKEIDVHLNSKNVREGAYVCSCGTFYTVQPCGFPTQISKCLNCGEKIGGENHILHRRDGHIRIFLNEEAKKSQIDNISYADKTMPYLLLNDYKLFVEKKEEEINLKVQEQNSNLMDKNDFINPELNLSYRKIDGLTFRILNFILYSHIFYSNIIDIISDEDIKSLQIGEMSIFDILEEDYKIIQILIKNLNNITDIKEFMNIIYYALEKDIEESEEIFDTKEKRELYEKKINEIINSSVVNYESDKFKNLKINYQENIRYLNLNKKSLKKIINQDYPPTENEYMDHPYLKELKFFMLSTCPSIDLLKKCFKNTIDGYKKYPVLNKILNANHEIELLQNIPILNEVSNSLRQYYSYNIERKEAKEKSLGIEKENLINNLFNSDKEKFNTLMKSFETGWNNIKDIAIKFECKDEMKPHEIKKIEDEKIAFFLVDKSELNYGMYLAAAYQSLIGIQTSFINSIINFSDENGNDSIHKNYIKQISKAINIQDAEKKDILKLCKEEKLNEIINLCSIRKCFSKEDGIVIFNNYEGIEMNLDKIEENLCDNVISQVKQFKPDITFVTYRFEGYRGKNSETLIKYMEKYKPQRKLNEDELSAIFNYIENNKDINYIEFLFDLQKMINYIQEENYKNEYSINDIINNMPSIIHLGRIKQFINNNNKIGKDNISLFTVNSLIDFYNLFEHLCWDDIKEKINNEYKKTFEENEKQKIKQYFDELGDSFIINKLNLSTSIRRFISKYLSGLTQDSEFDENKLLMEELKREDLWDYSFTAHPYFEREIDAINAQFQIKIGYAKNLYELLGGDESILTNIKNSVKIEKKITEKPNNQNKPQKQQKPKPASNKSKNKKKEKA